MRWTVVAYYLTDAGLIDIEYQIEELEELNDIVERGPSWFALDRIEIRLTSPLRRTIEATLAE